MRRSWAWEDLYHWGSPSAACWDPQGNFTAVWAHFQTSRFKWSLVHPGTRLFESSFGGSNVLLGLRSTDLEEEFQAKEEQMGGLWGRNECAMCLKNVSRYNA